MNGARDALEALVVSAWRNAVGRPPASIDEDFFLVGHTSLDAASLIAHLRTGLGRKVPLRVVFETPTVVGMAAALRTLDSTWRERYAFRLRDADSGIPLVLAPGTSGTLGWISALADARLGRPVIGLVSRGSYGEAPPLTTMPDIADHLLGALTKEGIAGPVHLLGSCVGGLAAVEMAARAVNHEIQVASVTLLNGSFAPDQMTIAERLHYRLNDIRRASNLPPAAVITDDFEAEIRALFDEVGGSTRIVESTLDEFTARLMVYVHNWHAAAAVVPTKVAAPLTLLYTTGDEVEVGLDAWRAAATRFQAYPVDGLSASNVGRPEVFEILDRTLTACDAEVLHA